LRAFEWTRGDLFDVPNDGKAVVGSLNGEAVRALGPEHAVMESGRLSDRGALTKNVRT
jgi:hypothetical protein